MLAARRFAQENPQAGQANLAAEGPPPAKPSTAARTSFAADAAEWEHEEKNAHHADNHPKNGVVHMPLPSLLWRDLSQERSRLNLPGLVEDAHPAWSHQESKDDEDDPGNDRASDRATMPAITSTAARIHKMCQRRPSLRASRELRTFLLPSSCGNDIGGAARPLTPPGQQRPAQAKTVTPRDRRASPSPPTHGAPRRADRRRQSGAARLRPRGRT